MSAMNSFCLIGKAKSEISTPFPNSKSPQQCFTLAVQNGDAKPFEFSLWLNPLSKFNEMRAIRGKTLAVQGIMRSGLDEKDGSCKVRLIATDIRIIYAPRSAKEGSYV